MKLTRITRYAVKSLQGTHLPDANLQTRGIDHDRRWALVHPDGVVATRRELPKMAHLVAVATDYGVAISHGDARIDVPFPSGETLSVQVWSSHIENAICAGEEADAFVQKALGAPVRLAYFPDTITRPVSSGEGHHTGFADGYPLLIATRASLNLLNTQLETPVEMRRFRPNLVIEGDTDPWIEDTWKRIRVGECELRIVKPCERCVMVLQDPKTGEKMDEREPLATLGRIHRSAKGKIIFGQNAVVEKPGKVALGDRVEVLESGASNMHFL